MLEWRLEVRLSRIANAGTRGVSFDCVRGQAGFQLGCSPCAITLPEALIGIFVGSICCPRVIDVLQENAGA